MRRRTRARDAEAALVVLGRALQRDLDGQARPRLVGAQRVLHLDHVRGRLDAGEVAELADLLDVVEHLAQLLAHALDLVLGELEAGEPGDVEHLVTAQHRAQSMTRRAWVGGSGRRRGHVLDRPRRVPGMRSSRVDHQPPAVAITAARKPSQAPASTSIAAFGPGLVDDPVEDQQRGERARDDREHAEEHGERRALAGRLRDDERERDEREQR